MYRKFFLKIIALLLALIVLAPALLFSVHKHLCGSRIQELSLYRASKGCNMERLATIHNSCAQLSKKKCCSDEVIIFEQQNRTSPTDLFIITSLYTAILVRSNYELIRIIAPTYRAANRILVRPPPLVHLSLYIQNQAFLI